MSLADDLAQLATPRPTKMQALVATLTDDERDAFHAACQSEAGSATIAAVLRRNGHAIGKSALSEYRADLRESR